MSHSNRFRHPDGTTAHSQSAWIRLKRRAQLAAQVRAAAKARNQRAIPRTYASRSAYYRHCKKALMRTLAPYWTGSRAALKARVRAYLAPRRKNIAFVSGILRATAIPGALAILMMALASPAAHGERTASFAAGTNPLDGVNVGSYSHISLADLDGDGDADAVTGESDGIFRYYENTGTATAPAFTQRTGGDNPLNGFDVGTESTPLLVDLDGDGDSDLISGVQTGAFTYFENTGSATAPAFTQRTGGDNPLDGFDVGNFSRAGAVDVDGDGDWDVFSGNNLGLIRYYENTGTAIAPAFTERTGAANPFDGVDIGDYSAMAFADLDGDGDPDAIIGNFLGTVRFFENTGTAVAPVFAEMTGAANPFNGIDVGAESRVAFADLDGDGDFDAFSGNTAGTFLFYVNSGAAFSPLGFAEQTGASNPFDGEDIGSFSTPAFVDADGDGDGDLFSGEVLGAFAYYENTGTVVAPAFTEQVGGANPLSGHDAGFSSMPDFADIDSDGDFDAFIGNGAGTILYFENTGTAIAPALVQQTGGDNPFNGAPVIGYLNLAFADLDGDGDLDAVAGNMLTSLVYFENTGTVIAPVFAQQTGAGDPFDGITVSPYAIPSLLDVDGDGDFDALIGNEDGSVAYIENTGTPLAPVMTARSSGAIPFIGLDLGDHAHPTFADLNGDGYPDAAVGLADGTVKYLIGGITPTLDANTGITLDEGATLAVTTTELSATDEDSTDSTLAFTVAPSNGQFENTDSPGSPITTFTQQDLIDGKIQYVHDGSNTTTDNVGVEVSDGTFALLGQTFVVTINPIDDTAPTIAVNTGMTVDEGTTTTITTGMLSATDADTDDGTLAFTVTTGPVNGQLENSDAPGNSITAFTQQDLIDGKIRYVHNDTNTTSDGFTFTVADGVPLQLTGQTFSITVTPVDDDTPTVAVNTGITLDEGATTAITTAELSATDTDTADGTLVYSITAGPSNGQVENTDAPGNPIASFTQQNLIDGKIRYVHDGSNTTSDGFTFTVADGTPNELTGQAFSIAVNAIDDDVPTLAANTGMTVTEGMTRTITTAELSATDEDSTDSTLAFAVTASPVNGRLENADAPGNPITSFTQQSLIDGKIRYVHDGSDTTSDAFTFSVADGVPNTLAGQVFSITVTPVDEVAPMLTLLGANPLTLECNIDTFIEPGYSAVDDVDGIITLNVVVTGDAVDVSTKGTYTITYTVTDSGDNVTQVSRTVHVVDTTPPNLSLVGDDPLELPFGATFTEPGATATDACDGNLTVSIQITGDVDTGVAGDYVRTYTVSDMSGNEAQIMRTVTVGGLPGDNNADGTVDAIDVQRIINVVLGILAEEPVFDVNGDSGINAADIQATINAALGVTKR